MVSMDASEESESEEDMRLRLEVETERRLQRELEQKRQRRLERERREREQQELQRKQEKEAVRQRQEAAADHPVKDLPLTFLLKDYVNPCTEEAERVRFMLMFALCLRLVCHLEFSLGGRSGNNIAFLLFFLWYLLAVCANCIVGQHMCLVVGLCAVCLATLAG